LVAKGQGGDSRGKRAPNNSGGPIQYANGAVMLPVTELASKRGGGFFGHRRSYYNQFSVDYDGPNGWNWVVAELPFAAPDEDGSVAIVEDPNNPWWFQPAGQGAYVSMFSVPNVALVDNPSTQALTYTNNQYGLTNVTVFNDGEAPRRPWQFVSHSDSDGTQTTIASLLGELVEELQRAYTVGQTTTVESLHYTYYADGTNKGKIKAVAYRRGPGAKGPWTHMTQVSYTYYGEGDPNGSHNDLMTATQQVWNGKGWDTMGMSYYRYWLEGSSTGFAHALKLDLGPGAYQAAFNDGVDIFTASDQSLQTYADHYFEYDPNTRFVTREVSSVCAGCPGGGATTDTFAYTTNTPQTPGSYNAWTTRTVQTLPDNSKIIVYTNFAGLTMLYVNQDPLGVNQWCTFYRYDASGNVIWIAHPSAVNGYNDAHDDLLNFNSTTGLYQYLNNTTGLIDVISFYASNGNGGALGMVANRNIRQGQSGTDVMTRSFTYTSNTDSNGNTVYLVATEVTYPVAGNQQPTITRSQSYTFYSSTNQMSSLTMTPPVVSAAQNGSGQAYTIVENYDAYSNLTQRTDERGIVNNYTIDPVIGQVAEQVLNVQSGVTAPGVNMTTDYSYDSQDRPTQTLGPSHTAVVSGTATSVRTVNWTVYIQTPMPASAPWAGDQTWKGQGYATGTGSSYTYNLINPVALTFLDKGGKLTDTITSKRTTGSGALAPGNTFAQTDYQSWTSRQYNDNNQQESTRVYFNIPPSGAGSSGTNYAETDYGYDALERRNRVQTPGGTITRTVWTTPQRVASEWMGTNDTGATDSDPTGGGAPGNNMVIVTANIYDNGGIGDGNVTQVTQYASSSSTRVTSYAYDFRDRQISMTGPVNVYEAYSYDNRNLRTQTQQYNTSSSGNLIGQTGISYDDRGRAYQTLTYAVDPGTGAIGNALTSNTWYDPSGNLLQQISEGTGQVFIKSSYNGVNWVTARYAGYNTTGTSYNQATTVSGDIIVNQSVRTYDEAGNTISSAGYDRLNDASASTTGALTSSNARISYTAGWFDGVNRSIATANYGAASGFSRPGTPPVSSATVLVNQAVYDDAGRLFQSIDPNGYITQTLYDNAGRKVQVLEAFGTSDQRETDTTYTLDGQVATLTAVNTVTGNQTTTYTYGTTLSTSGVARNDLLAYVDYPDSVNGSDRVGYTYNRQGQQLTITDQRGTVRTKYYDQLGRSTNDCVTTVGSGTDDTVLQIAITYEVRGMVQSVTSYNNPTPGSGTILNQCSMTYNSFSQLIEEQQDHSGPVSGSSPSVQYGYDSGGSNSNENRKNSLTYPSGRVISYVYGPGMDSTLNRITSIQDAATSVNLATYTYLGQGTVVRITYPQPSVWLDLWGGQSGIFTGIDLFGRIIDQRWQNNINAQAADIDCYQYGYDQDSNRLWKRNAVGTALDEYYTYDSLNRLTDMQRGTLNNGRTGITGTPVKEQDWTLDPTGNWTGFIDSVNGIPDLNQSRTANTVNEITNISASGGTPVWVTPAYDPAGNTTTFPQSDDPTSSFSAIYDAWNRMTAVSSSSTPVTTYAYDGRNRRIAQNSYSSGTVAETRDFFFTNAWQDIEEWVAGATNPQDQYVWGIRYVDELICRDDATPARHYAAQDANFNLTGICNTTGAVVERYLYDPYGTRTVMNASWTVLSASAYDWVIGFQGLQYDVGSGLIFCRNRHLHAILGRWTQRDIGYLDGMNLYEIEGSCPLTRIDPDGRGFIALADRSVDDLPWWYHYSLELWFAPCQYNYPNREYSIETWTKNDDMQAEKSDSIQLLNNTWHQDVIGGPTTNVSVIYYNQDSGTSFLALFPDDDFAVQRKWDSILSLAHNYGYAEQYGSTHFGAEHWPNSHYEKASDGNNSKTFIKTVVGNAGLTWAPLGGWHPGADSPHTITGWPNGVTTPPFPP
jgi:RHS repeat-associated protein